MNAPKKEKLLGNAELSRGGLFIRLSRSVDPTRKRYPVEDPAITTLEQARQLAHRLSIEALDQKLKAPPKSAGDTCKGDACKDWFDAWCKERVRRGAVTTDRHDRGRFGEHIQPVIGGWRMATIPRDKIEEVVEALDAKIKAGTISWKTAATTWGVVATMFKDACGSNGSAASKAKELRVRDDNPAIGVAPPDRGGEKAKAFLYPSEFWKLITSRVLTHGDGLPAHVAANVANASRRWLRTFVLAAYLGTRAGELAALDWQDVDLEHWTVFIHRAAERDTGRRKEKETKTEVTRRFEIEPALRPLLLAMWREQGKPKRGKVIDVPHEADLSERLQRYLTWAKVDRAELFISDKTRCRITFKDLRATYATWRAIRGDDPLKIQRAAGHKSLNTTQIYIRAAEDLGGRAGKPFPPLPPFVLGATATARAHLESVKGGRKGSSSPGEDHRHPVRIPASRPASVPKPSRKTSKRANSQDKVASPAGFERAKVAETPAKRGRFGTIGPKNDRERPRTITAFGTAFAPSGGAIARALEAAIASGRIDDAAELAAELATKRRRA